MFRKISAALLAICLVTSCGGGGGGGGGSSSGGGGDGIRFTPDRSSVDFAYDEGLSSMPMTNVNVNATGTFSGTLYIGAVVEGQGIDPNIPASISGQTATFSIRPRSGLSAGTYTGRVQLLGCRDAACANQIGNSPVIITYTLNVRVSLQATPGAVSTTAQSGSTTSSNVTIRLPSGATAFTTAFSSGSEWMSIDQVSSAGFRVNMRSLPPGVYSGFIHVSAGTSQIDVPVNHTVAGGVAYSPMIVSPGSLTLTGSEGAVNAPVMLDVTAPSWDPSTSVRFVQGASNNPVPWLSATPNASGYSVVVNATDLLAGTYNASAMLTGAYPQPELQVPIALTIGIGLVMPADQIKVINSESTAATLNGTVPVDVVAGPPVNWTAQSFAPWLVLTDSAGVTGETLAFQVDPALLPPLTNGGDEVLGGITITPQRQNMSPRTFAVRVRGRLAEVTSVGPAVQPAGRDARIILRGIGFDGITNLAARLQFTGGVVSQITRVNDTELIVHTGPLGLGTFPFSFTNALGRPVASAAVRTYAPTVFANASLATGGELRGLFYDAQRSAAYAVNSELERLQKFRFGAQWELSELPVPAIVSAGLDNDGTRLLVASAAHSLNRIRQLDPADMNVQISSTDLTRDIYHGSLYVDGVIPSTNDGRAWFSLGSGWNDIAYFNPADSQLTIVRPNAFYLGPRFAISRDGERLVIMHSGTNGFDAGALYLDAADGEVRLNPAGLSSPNRATLSDDGSRLVLDTFTVRDREFTLIGRIPTLPQIAGEPRYFVMNSILSPDGARLYALAYPDTFDTLNYPARLFVFDSSTRQLASDDLPLLGHLNLGEYPSCTYSNQNCNPTLHMAMAPDGNNLFVAGNLRFMVLPAANATLTPAMKVSPVAQKVGRGATVPWHLDLK